jgi:hypothetical protein
MAKIVEAAGAAIGTHRNIIRSKAIQNAMAEAVKKCAEEGITDPVEIRRRMMEARESVKQAGQ